MNIVLRCNTGPLIIQSPVSFEIVREVFDSHTRKNKDQNPDRTWMCSFDGLFTPTIVHLAIGILVYVIDSW